MLGQTDSCWDVHFSPSDMTGCSFRRLCSDWAPLVKRCLLFVPISHDCELKDREAQSACSPNVMGLCIVPCSVDTGASQSPPSVQSLYSRELSCGPDSMYRKWSILLLSSKVKNPVAVLPLKRGVQLFLFKVLRYVLAELPPFPDSGRPQVPITSSPLMLLMLR